MHASKRSADLSTGAAVFLACAAVVAGVGGWYRGVVSADMAVGAAMLAVGVLASQRTMWLHSSPAEAGALSNAGLFAIAAGAKIGGVDLGVAAVQTAGEALFLIAVAYYLVRAYGR